MSVHINFLGSEKWEYVQIIELMKTTAVPTEVSLSVPAYCSLFFIDTQTDKIKLYSSLTYLQRRASP